MEAAQERYSNLHGREDLKSQVVILVNETEFLKTGDW
jgi:hypothetical protein